MDKYFGYSSLNKAINERKLRVRAWFIKQHGDKCSKCKKKYPAVCYDIHHINPNTKTKTTMWELSNEELENELEGCILLCSNCHRVITWKSRTH